MFACKHCGREFENARALGGHSNGHTRTPITLEECKKDGTRKNCLIRERGHRCEVCKSETWMDQPIPLELDHVDGNPENNDRTNLRVICPNCHAQTPTYRGKNAGRVQNTKRQQTLLRSRYKYR